MYLVSCLFSLFKDQFSLEQICGGSVFASHDKCINMLVNFILPLCIRLGCARKGIKSTCYWILRNFKVIVIHVQNYTCIITCRYIHVLTISHDLFHKLSHSSQETLPSWEQTMWPLPWLWSWIFCVPLPGTPSSSRTPAPSPPYITFPSPRITAVAASVSQTRSTGQRTSYCSMWLILVIKFPAYIHV